jgi:hypothetical protein
MSTAVHNAHGAQIYFGDLTPYLTYGAGPPMAPFENGPERNDSAEKLEGKKNNIIFVSSAVVQPSSDVIPPHRSITAAGAGGKGGGAARESKKREFFRTKHACLVFQCGYGIRILVLNNSFGLLNRSGKAIILDWQKCKVSQISSAE